MVVEVADRVVEVPLPLLHLPPNPEGRTRALLAREQPRCNRGCHHLVFFQFLPVCSIVLFWHEGRERCLLQLISLCLMTVLVYIILMRGRGG